MTERSTQTLDESVLSALLESVGGDDAFVVDLIETYVVDGTGQMDAIAAAVAAGDAHALVRPAHTLKSASYTVGATRLGDLARSLEHLGRSGVLDDAATLAAAAAAEWDAVGLALRSWTATNR
jgi:two-component system, sensor histidine kinase